MGYFIVIIIDFLASTSSISIDFWELIENAAENSTYSLHSSSGKCIFIRSWAK
jgi:hypothetical protein